MGKQEYAVIRFGVISDKKASAGLVRVTFPQDNLVSSWLPMLFKRTSGDQEVDSKKVQEKVVCLMDENCENGIVLGSYYDQKTTPPSIASDTVSGRVYADGTKIYYDSSSSTYTIQIGEVKIQFSKLGIFSITNGTDSLGSILTTLGTALGVFATACAGSTVDPVLASAATALNTQVIEFNTKLPTLLS